MPNTRVVVNRRAVRWYLQGNGGVRENLAARAAAIAAQADANSGRPGDHRVDSAVGANRIRYAVITGTWNAMWREARGRALTRALGAGR